MFYRHSVLQFRSLFCYISLYQIDYVSSRKLKQNIHLKKRVQLLGKINFFLNHSQPYGLLQSRESFCRGLKEAQLKSFLFEWCKFSSIKKLETYDSYWKESLLERKSQVKSGISLTTVSPAACFSLKNPYQEPPAQFKFIIS